MTAQTPRQPEDGQYRADRFFWVGGARFVRMERYNRRAAKWEYAFNARAASAKVQDALKAVPHG